MTEINIYKDSRTYILAKMIVDNNFTKFVEIGLYKCSMLKMILKSNMSDKIEEYWGVDNFNHIESGYHRELTTEVWDMAYAQACRLMIKHKSLRILRMKSVNASMLFKNGYIDMIFIDGSHDYDSVSEDIKSWEPKIRKGGIISGHDYDYKTGKWGWNVKKAVDDYYGERVNILPGCIWYVNL